MSKKTREQELQNQQIEIKGVKIRFPNFTGRGDKYNREGAKNFLITLTEAEADRLAKIGFNIKRSPAREEGEADEFRLKINVQYQTAGRKPRVTMYSGKNKTLLSDETVELLDDSRIIDASIRFRPFFYDEEDPSKCSAYLTDLFVKVEVDELADAFEADLDEPAEEHQW